MEKKCECGGNCTCTTDKTPLTGSAQNSTSLNLSSINGYSSGTINFDPYFPKSVVDAEVNEETITITYIQRAMYSYTTINSTITISSGMQKINHNDRVFKEVYGVVDGKLTHIKTIYGRIVPPTLEESYEFDEE